MGRINKLDISVANLIAAGEVVDRPCSALKELLENAVDSGAKRITAEVRRGGISSIRVSDDGCGMSREDLPISVLRHATSKIRTAADLSAIGTLGFRGEALAAISAVSDLRILSRRAEDEEGALLESAAGCVPTVSTVGCAVGTTVVAENLFANVPARQKFLKSDRTEALACCQVTEKLALSHPEISFRFLSDGTERFETSGDGDQRNVLYALYGREFASNLVRVDGNNSAIRVEGFVGTPVNNRSNRGYENFFINGRFVRSRTAQAALEEAFRSFMAEGKFPVCALWITIPLGSVDVNVHPAKLEVKFSNEKLIFDAVYYAVRSAIKNDTQRPSIHLSESPQKDLFRFPASDSRIPAGKPEHKETPHTIFDTAPTGDPFIQSAVSPLSHPSDASSANENAVSLHAPLPSGFYSAYAKYSVSPKQEPIDFAPVSVSVKPTPEPFSSLPLSTEGVSDNGRELSQTPTANSYADKPMPSEGREKEVPILPIRYVGIVFETYIVAERGNDLLLIDKHAAHERILYEEMMRTLRADSIAPAMLLIPIELSISSVERAALLDYESEIKDAGFEFCVDSASVSVSQIPGCLTPEQASDLLVSLLGSLADGEGKSAVQARDELFSRSLYTASCKAAMKGGICDGEEHLRWICQELSRCADIRVCPHGRPVVTVLSRNYLDRSFGRLL